MPNPAAALNKACRALAHRLLLRIKEKGQTYEMASEIHLRIALLLGRAEKTPKKPREASEHFIGMIEAQCSLILPMGILGELKRGRSSDEIRESYPKYETSLSEGWEECLLNLREVAGLAVPMTVFKRDRVRWIRHWRSLYHLPSSEPKKMRKDVIKAAKKRYPGINLEEITSL